MSAINATLPAAIKQATVTRPAKPYAEFPLFPHGNGQWAKKIRGKMTYFGPWADPEAALENYSKQKDDLHAGRQPKPEVSAGVAVRDIVNLFLNDKRGLVEGGELSARTWSDYHDVCMLVKSEFGASRLVADLGPDDFTALRLVFTRKGWGPDRLKKFVQITKSLFKYGYEAGLFPLPRFGPGFKLPSKKVMRLHRAKQGPKFLEADECRKLIDAASTQLRAMVLLGLNCGYGNTDCGVLKMTDVDLVNGWATLHRGKTGIDRRCPLWPETVQAIKAAMAKRPTPKDPAHAGLLFVTRLRTPWINSSVDEDGKAAVSDSITKAVRLLFNELGIGRSGMSFYTLRHIFRTVADEARDQPACDAIMGHVDGSMANHYRERMSDDRLKAVTDHVRQWVFGEKEKMAPGGADSNKGTPGADAAPQVV